MPDEAHPTERIRPADVARITSLSVRKVQELAAAGRIPGAAKMGGAWTFSEEKLRAWIKNCEAAAAERSVVHREPNRRPVIWGDMSLVPAETIQAAYDAVVRPKRPRSLVARYNRGWRP